MCPRIGLTREKLIEVCTTIVDKEGWEQLTLANVATNLGIKTPSLYNHISSLEDLKKGLAIYGAQQLYYEIIVKTRGLEGTDAIIAFSKAYLSFSKRHPGLYIISLTATNSYGDEALEIGNRLVNLLFSFLDKFSITQEEKVHIIRGLRSLLHGFISLEQHNGFQMNIDIEKSIIYCVNALVNDNKI